MTSTATRRAHADAEGAKVTNTYDGRGLVTQIVEDFESGPPARQLTTKIAYDAVGNQKHLYSPRAVEAAAPSAPTPSSDYAQTFEYDGLDRPVRVLLPKQGSEARRYVHRRYDNVGNLTHVTVPVTENSLSTILASASETRRWVTQYEHFDTGWIRRSENQNGPVIYDYAPEGWQTSRKPTRPAGDSRDTFRTYYRDGLLETFADEKNNLVLRQWDRNGNLSFLKDSGVTSDRRPITLDIDHNGFDEVIATIALEENRHTTSTTYSYNLDGLVATRNDDREEDSQGGLVRAARRNQFTYDADGRVTLHEDFGRGSSRTDDKRITQTYFATDREREQLVEQWIGSDASGAFEPRQTTRREYFANGLLRTLRNVRRLGRRAAAARAAFARLPRSGRRVRQRPSHERRLLPQEPAVERAVPARGRQLRAALALRRRRPARGGERRPRQPDVVQARRGRRHRGEAQRRDRRAAVRGRLRRHADRERDQERRRRRSCSTTSRATSTARRRRAVRATTATAATTRHRRCARSTATTTAAGCPRGSPAARARPTTTTRSTASPRRPSAPAARTNTRDLSYVGSTMAVSEEEERGQRTITRSYSYDPDGRRVGMTFQRGSGTPRELTYAQDPHGNVSMLINESGDVKASYGYTAYGESDNALTAERLPDSDAEPGSGEDVNPFRYSSKRTDATSGTVDMGARQFGPELGQFLQADRLDDALGDVSLSSDPLTGNRYALAGGNPVSFVEWDGHAPHDRRHRRQQDTQEDHGRLHRGPEHPREEAQQLDRRWLRRRAGAGSRPRAGRRERHRQLRAAAKSRREVATTNKGRADQGPGPGPGIAKDLAENKAQAIQDHEKARKAAKARRVKPLTAMGRAARPASTPAACR